MDKPLDQRAAMVDRPGVVLRVVYARLFAFIAFDEEAVARIRAAAARGPVVYVLPSVSYMVYLYFSYALKKHGLPLARFANGGVRTILLWPVRVAFAILVAIWRLARGVRLEPEEDTVRRMLAQDESVLLFLRPARILVEDPGEAARVRGTFFEALVGEQRRRTAAGLASLQVVPLQLVLGKVAVRQAGVRGAGRGTIDAIFGEAEAPGRLRTFLQFIWHNRSSKVMVSEPIDVGALLAADGGERSDEALARTLRFEASGAIERERRVLQGPPVKSARRVRLDVMRSRRLIAVIDKLAAQPDSGGRDKLAARARKILGEIAAYPRRWAFNAFRVGLKIVFERMYEGIDVDEEGLERVREAARHGPLLLLPSHKSHIDYLILSYVFYERGLAPPHVAAGSNLSFFPMGFLFRRTAAFFLRRSFRGDELYAAVFEAYLRRLLRDGFTVEFFIEGGRSRTGKVLSPRYGLLSTVADAAWDGDAPSAQVVPIALSYEKLVEEKSYQRELEGGKKKKEGLGSLLRAGRVLGARYGRIDLQFSAPFPLREALGELPPGLDEKAGAAARKRAVQRLGHRVAYEINQATAVTPTALVAAAALATGVRALPEGQLDANVRLLYRLAGEGGARFSASIVEDFETAIARTVTRMASSGDLDVRGHGAEQLVVVPAERRLRLEYYKNNLIHALADLSIVARAIGDKGGELPAIEARAQVASRLLKKELIFRPGKGFPRAFAETMAWLERAGLARRDGARVIVTDAGRAALPVLAGLTGSYLQSYWIVARAVAEASPDVAKNWESMKRKGFAVTPALAPRAQSLGERSLLLAEINRPEALSLPVMKTGWDYLKEVGALDSRAALDAVFADLDVTGR